MLTLSLPLFLTAEYASIFSFSARIRSLLSRRNIKTRPQSKSTATGTPTPIPIAGLSCEGCAALDNNPSDADGTVVVDREKLGDVAKCEEEEARVEEFGSAALVGPKLGDDELCEGEEAGVEEES